MYDARILFAGLILTLFTGSAAAVTVYECEDEKGNRTFESACPPGTQEVKKKAYAADGATAPDDTAGDLPEVTLYLVPACDTCVQTRDYLDARDIPYTSKDVSTDFALQEELKKRSGALRAPTVMIGDQAVVGFNRASLTTALQEAGHIPAEVEGATGEAETGATEAEPGTGPETPAP